MDERHYKKAYGKWAGNREGRPPILTNCCKQLFDKYHPGGYQCTRKRGFGPDEAYCKQHDPQAVAAREAKRNAKYDAEWERRRIEIAGARFFAALRQIADGHNDPRALAREAIAPFLTKEADQP